MLVFLAVDQPTNEDRVAESCENSPTVM